MSQVWEFDLARLLTDKFPGLLRKEHDKAWEEWVKAVCRNPRDLNDLVRAHNIPIPFRARGILAQILPPELLRSMVLWGKPTRNNTPKTSRLYQFGRSEPLILQKLRYEVLCGVLEAIPESPQFDRSDDPVAIRLPEMNKAMRTYFSERRGAKAPDWVDESRIAECYRVQQWGKSRDAEQRWPFQGYLDLFDDKDINIYPTLMGLIGQRMQRLAQREIDGEDSLTGAVQALVAAISWWESVSLNSDLAKKHAEFLVGIDNDLCPWEVRMPEHLLGGPFGVIALLADNPESITRLGWHYLVIPAQFPAIKLQLAKTVLEVSRDAKLRRIAERVVAEEGPEIEAKLAREQELKQARSKEEELAKAQFLARVQKAIEGMK